MYVMHVGLCDVVIYTDFLEKVKVISFHQKSRRSNFESFQILFAISVKKSV